MLRDQMTAEHPESDRPGRAPVLGAAQDRGDRPVAVADDADGRQPAGLAFRNADYPALFVAADAAAGEGRRGYTRLIGAELALLVAAAALSATQPLLARVLPATGLPWEQMTAAVLLAAALVAKLANRLRAFDDEWFDGRAVAETIKSTTWRYAMRVPPYDGDDAAADATFVRALRETLAACQTLAKHLHRSPPDARQITGRMRTVRAAPLAVRQEVYLAARVADQVGWYAARARASAHASGLWFWASLGFEGVALAVAITQVATGGGPDLVSLFAAISAAATAWTQLGRHDELSKSYSLAAQELVLLRSTLEAARGEADFRQAVEDTESAISREHTMWMAKRG